MKNRLPLMRLRSHFVGLALKCESEGVNPRKSGWLMRSLCRWWVLCL